MTDQRPGGRRTSGPRIRQLLRRLLLITAVPMLVYFVVRPFVADDAIALGCVAGAELLLSLIRIGARRRRSVPLTITWALLSVTWVGGALALTIVSHGSPLPFKLARPIYTGIVGLVLLVSVAIGRPIGASLAERAPVRVVEATDSPRRPSTRTIGPLVAAIGGLLVVEALVTVGLAFALPTAAFVVVSRVAALFLFAVAGLASVGWALRRAIRGR